MKKVEAGHYQSGIYHARKLHGGHWKITVEDGKGFPFEPIVFTHLYMARQWLGE